MLARPALLLCAGVLLAVGAFQFWISPTNPPGFIRDEASISLNAYDLSRDLRDQDGTLLPLYFSSFGDYKSPVFVYALAVSFRLFGPHAELARGLAAACVLAAVLLLAFVAWRRTRSVVIAAIVLALAGTTPFLFELGRVAYETAIEPLALALVMLAVDWAWRARRWSLGSAVVVGLALGLLTYTYAGARLLAPLAAVALVVVVSRARLSWLLTAWATFGASLLPLGIYAHRHPGALTARYEATTFVHGDMSRFEIVTTAVGNYFHDLNPWQWVTEGDPKPYVHTWGAGSIYAVTMVAAAAGVVEILRHRQADPFWRYAVALLVAVPIPAALADARYYALRLAPFPLVLALLMVPALERFRPVVARSRTAVIVTAALGVLTVAQFAHFVERFHTVGPTRTQVFEAGVPSLLALAFDGKRTVYIDHDDRYAQTHALWYAASHGIPAARVAVLADGGVAPTGAIVFGRLQGCDYVCNHVAEAQDYWVARAAGPNPS